MIQELGKAGLSKQGWVRAGGEITLLTSRAMLSLLINHPGEGRKTLRRKGKRGNQGETLDICQDQVF